MTVRLAVFDVDGTLYDQRVLRSLMAGELALFLIRHPLRFRDVFIVREYRRVHESFHRRECDNLEETLIATVAAALSVSNERVRNVVDEWLFQRPLKYLKRVCFAEIVETITCLKKNGVIVTFVSDHYPVGKLKALGLDADGVYYSTRPDLSCLKPNPKLLFRILSDHGVPPGDCVVIGDRDDRDGELARAAGARFVLFPNRVTGPGLLARIESCAS